MDPAKDGMERGHTIQKQHSAEDLRSVALSEAS